MRLAATAVCLLAAGAAVIIGVCGLAARGYLQAQADQQLRGYAGRLIGHPFVLSPLYGVAAGVPSAGGLGVEVRGSAGQVVVRAGPPGRPGPAIPAVPASVAARGQLATVAADGGNDWRVITEPIRYRTWRIPFTYSPEGFYAVITSTARKGRAGTLVIGLDLRSAGLATGRLAVTGLAVSGVVILAVTCLAVVVSRAILRPVTRAEQALTALAAGRLSHRVAEPNGGEAGRLAVALNTMLSQLEHAFHDLAATEAAARRSIWQMAGLIADTGQQLRKPLSIVHGVAGSYRRGGQPSAGELDLMMRRVADEAARMDALAGELALTRDDQPPGGA